MNIFFCFFVFSFYCGDLFFPSRPPVPEKYSITITITGVRNTKGSILIKFYDDKMRFPETNGFRIVSVSKSLLVNDSITVTYHNFAAKHMGVSLLDDENNNLKLDFGLLFPKEGHAFSDYHHTALRKPVYEDFRFLLTGHKKVIMKMKYY
jgi:uncharacterized protein (DUF2141 family)